ncbi:MAG: hypothetical protein ACM3Q2_18945 [Syntrophothermus sp.]
MEENLNKKNQPLFILIIVTICLFLLSFVPEHSKLGSWAVRRVDLFSDIKADLPE